MDTVEIKKPLCAIYARVSTDIQEESVAHQVSLMREFAKTKGLGEIPDEFIYEDMGVSATKHSIWTRPAMKRLLADAEQGKFQTVLFKGISRFARSTQEALNVLEMLKSKGLRVISYEENYDSAQENSNFLFTIHSAVAEYEAEKISVRVKLGRKEVAKQGIWVGKIPTGYRKGEDGNLVIHEEEAEVIRQIFDMYTNKGVGTTTIARYLNDHKILGRTWVKEVILHILKNEAYIGNVVFNKITYKRVLDYESDELGKKKIKKVANPTDEWVVVEGAHEPIIDKDTFLRAQKILASRRRGDNKPRSTYLLTGILYCGRCGKTMVGSTTQRISKGRKLKWSYYRCRTARNFGRIECSQPNLNRFKLDKLILAQVKQKVLQLKTKSGDGATPYIESIRKNLDKLKSELRKIDQKIDLINQKTADLYFEKDNMTPQQYEFLTKRLKEEMERLLSRKAELEADIQLSEEGEKQTHRIEQDIREFLKELHGDELDEKRVRTLLHRLVERIDVDGNKIQIKYKFSF